MSGLLPSDGAIGFGRPAPHLHEPPAGETRRVCVVDDDPATARLIERCLRRAPGCRYAVSKVHDPETALCLVEADEFDCILLDQHLGATSGTDLLVRLRRRGCDTPVVLMTDEGDETAAVHALEIGAQDYLRKADARSLSLHRAVSHAAAKVGLERRIRSKQREMESFASALAHDLRQPLTVIKNNAELLRDFYGPNLDEKGRCFVEAQIRMADQAFEMVASMLTHARAEVTGADLRPLDLSECLQEALGSLESEISESMADVRVDCALRVRGEKPLLIQVFQNLIGNALKYRSQDPPRVRVSAWRRGDIVRVVVEDNGIGFHQRQAESIFEPFVRLQGRSEREGFGIGLATCRRIIEGHGGRIWAESEPGSGSRFFVELEAAPAAEKEGASHGARPVRILVVDDEPSLGSALSEILQRRGHQVCLLRTAKDAYEAVRGGGIDIVVSDLLLPGESGVDFVRDVKNAMQGLPVIAVSGGNGGVSSGALLAQASSSGADRIFSKPVEIARLMREIESLTAASA